MVAKLNYDFVKSSFESSGYQLLSTEYVNQRHKLIYRCPRGHQHKISYADWHSGRRCRLCRNEDTGNRRRLDFDVVKCDFENDGYKLVSDTYENNDIKLDYICPVGHKGSMSYHNFKNGWRCIKCRVDRQRLICGDLHPMWKGGISCEPYCDAWADKEYKKSIMERDVYKCQNPYCRGNCNHKLSIHHIDYNKKNCHPSNLITVCRSCNSMANFNRGWHKQLYTDLIQKIMAKEV